MSTRHTRNTTVRAKKAPPSTSGRTDVTPSGNSETTLSEDERRRMVAEAAYYRALQRGFTAGGEVDDWLAAEREITQRLIADDARHASGKTIGQLSRAKPEGADMRTRPA